MIRVTMVMISGSEIVRDIIPRDGWSKDDIMLTIIRQSEEGKRWITVGTTLIATNQVEYITITDADTGTP